MPSDDRQEQHGHQRQRARRGLERRGGSPGPRRRRSGGAASAAPGCRARRRSRTRRPRGRPGRTGRGPTSRSRRRPARRRPRPAISALRCKPDEALGRVVGVASCHASASSWPCAALPAPRRPARRRGAPVGRRHVVDRRVLAELQRADVGGDRPAVARRDLRGVVRHRAEAVGDHVEEVADGACRSRSRGSDAGWRSRAARPCRCRRRAAVAGRAVDVEALLAALQLGVRRSANGNAVDELRRRPCRCRARRPRAAGRGRRCPAGGVRDARPSAKKALASSAS